MDAKEDIKQRLAIEDVVARYVELRRAGRNFKGLSPFNAEKTPSFVVSPEKQIWHDFSSGRGGDMFSFVMEMEGLDFKGALELLARQAGVDLEQYRQSSAGQASGKAKERLHAANELAAKFYQAHFAKSKLALEYVLGQRQFSKATALTWRLGYSPGSGTALLDFLKNQGYSENEIKQAGLIGSYGKDMFRGRLMIPLCDPSGRVVGFTARLLEKNDQAPKYINTPATQLYDKSRHVFGLEHAKQAIRRSKFALLVEGNLDVIMSHQAGSEMAVATAGTALTDLQLKALKRLTGDIRLCFDADRAGRDATERALPIASRVGVELSVVTLPSGKDPDELIKQNADAWRSVIEKPAPALDWLMTRYEAELDLTTSSGKKQFRDVMLGVLRGLSDNVEREHYLELTAQKLGVSKAALTEVMAHDKSVEARLRPTKVQPGKPSQEQKQAIDYAKSQNHLLALLLHQPKLREAAMRHLSEDMFTSEPAKHLFNFLETNQDFTGKPEQAELLREIADYVKMEALQFEALYDGLELNELRYEAAHLQAHLIEQYVKTQKQHISNELQSADEGRQQDLLVQARQLDGLLRRSQEEKVDGNRQG